MGLKISGLNELRERLERLRPEEVMAKALAEQAARMAARVRDGLSEPPGAAGHDEPWLRTGALRDSVGAQADGLQAAVGSSNPAAVPQELGTAKMPARPFLAPVAAGMGEEVARAVGAAVAAALRGDSPDASITRVDLGGGEADPGSAQAPNGGSDAANSATHAGKSVWQQVQEVVTDPHTVLGAASFVPSVPGAVASAADGALYAAEGKWADAAIALGAAAVGMVSDAGAARLAGKGLKAGAEVLGAAGHAAETAADAGKTARAADSGIAKVLQETAQRTGNLTSAHTLSQAEVLEAGIAFLGTGYREIGKPGSGVFRSADGLRQFRIDSNSLAGAHAPGVPHAHFEIYATPTSLRPTTNNHVPVTP